MRRESKEMVENMLIELGLSPSYKGFKYVVDAVELLYNDENNKITVLYREVAAMNNTTGSRVERAIRFIIEVAYCNNKELAISLLGINHTNASVLHMILLKVKRRERNER